MEKYILRQNETSIFIKNGYYYIVKKDDFEPIEKFNERGWFIANKMPKTKEEYNEAVRLSRIWINMKYNDAIYPNIQI